MDAKALLAKAEAAKTGGVADVEEALADAASRQSDDRETARALCWTLSHGVLPPEETADHLHAILLSHGHDASIVADIGAALEYARDIDDLNAPPPAHRLFETYFARISECLLAEPDTRLRTQLLSGQASAARLMARQKDEIAERAYRELVALQPNDSDAHYILALFLKTRGRFAEAAAANATAIKLHQGGGSEAAQWNLGITATGARDGETALKVWKAMGNKIEMGPHGRPEGSYPSCKVRLAQRPLAERAAASDDPGIEETIWIERLSPCHGIVRSILFNPELGVDFGDTVLFDGAPITYHLYGETRIPVFPHLATLDRGGYIFHPFSAIQSEKGSLDAASADLDHEPFLYVHTGALMSLCQTCWRDDTVQHETHAPKDHSVVHGRLAVPPTMPPAVALSRIDKGLSGYPGTRLFAPTLAQAVGDTDRARMEQDRFTKLRSD